MAYRLFIGFRDKSRPDFHTPVEGHFSWKDYWLPIIEAHKLDLLWEANGGNLSINRHDDWHRPLTVETLTQLEHELDVMQKAFEARTDLGPAFLSDKMERIERVREAISLVKQDIDAIEDFHIG